MVDDDPKGIRLGRIPGLKGETWGTLMVIHLGLCCYAMASRRMGSKRSWLLLPSLGEQSEYGYAGLGADVYFAVYDQRGDVLVSVSKAVSPVGGLSAVVELMG